MKISTQIIAIFLSMLSVSTAFSSTPEKDKVELKVQGLIQKNPSEDKKSFNFSMEKLRQMPSQEVAADNKYIVGKSVFKGVLVRDILKEVDADPKAQSMIFEGADGYAIRAPVADSLWNVIIAYEVNGKAMPAKEKGPLWVIYPLNEKPSGMAMRDAVDRMVWNLKKVTLQ